MSEPRALFGVETEVSCAALGPDGEPGDPEEASWAVVAAVQRRVPHLGGGSDFGIWPVAGGRLYVDRTHLEYATPEVDSPWKAVRYIEGGALMLERAARQMQREVDGWQYIELFRGPSVYGDPPTTWASCHESYAVRNDPQEIERALAGHVVSRLCYTAAGGLDVVCESEPRFILSPRGRLTTAVRRDPDLRGRSLFDNRAGRIHITCSEPLISHFGTFLKLGATALVAILADRALLEDPRLRLFDSIGAVDEVSADPTLRASLYLESGERVTAIALQRRILDRVREHVHRDFMPRWSEAVCRVWKWVLAALASDRRDEVLPLDWILKRQVFEHAGEHLKNRRPARRSPLRYAISRSAVLESKHAQRRAELAEVDLLFGRLGGGIFGALEDAGLVKHRLVSEAEAALAITTPPGRGRAAFRGRAIRELWEAKAHAEADWDRIADFTNERWLDLSSPLVGSRHAPLPWTPMEMTIDDDIPF